MPINILTHVLNMAGIQVVELDRAEKILPTIQAAFEQDQAFDLIFMDINMPVMDGREATRQIRTKDHHDIPIIAMTADVMKEDQEMCFECGMNDYVVKPIRRETVFKMVQKWALEDDTL